MDVILSDFAKDFDEVPFQRLLLKSSFYAIRDNTVSFKEVLSTVILKDIR